MLQGRERNEDDGESTSNPPLLNDSQLPSTASLTTFRTPGAVAFAGSDRRADGGAEAQWAQRRSADLFPEQMLGQLTTRDLY